MLPEECWKTHKLGNPDFISGEETGVEGLEVSYIERYCPECKTKRTLRTVLVKNPHKYIDTEDKEKGTARLEILPRYLVAKEEYI